MVAILASCGSDDDAAVDVGGGTVAVDDVVDAADEMAELLSDPAQILETLRNHSLDGTQTAADLTAATTVETRAGESLPVTVEGDTVMIGDVQVVTTDIAIAFGVAAAFLLRRQLGIR